MARRIGPAKLLGCVGLIALLAALTSPAQAPVPPKDASKGTMQDPNRPRVPVPTVDFVDLDATYYRAASPGRDIPCVILVHKWGSDRTKSGWDELARELQKQGFAVLSFDLRGHGASTSISPSFWSLGANKNGILRANPAKQTTIEAKNFKPTYFPWVVNDLLAARRFLETKNDAGELNIGSLFVIGAQEGATLGFEFLTSEWYRTYTIGFKALQSNGITKTAGKDIAGGVWLSMPVRPNVSTTLPMRDWIRNTAGLRDETSMCFIYGEKDSRAKSDTDELMRALGTTAGRDRHTRLEIKGSELVGQSFLGAAAEGLGVRQKIVEYLKKVMNERKQVAWSEVEPNANPLQTVNMRNLGVTVP